jgi:hypothetical protein
MDGYLRRILFDVVAKAIKDAQKQIRFLG